MGDVRENLISELIDEIGLLIQSRITAYIQKYAGASKAKFINKFLCVLDGQYPDPSTMDWYLKVKNEFDEFVSGDLINVELTNFFIDEDFEIEFELDVCPIFIAEDVDIARCELKIDKLTSYNDELIKLLDELEADQLAKYVKKVRNGRTIMSLKDD